MKAPLEWNEQQRMHGVENSTVALDLRQTWRLESGMVN